VQVLEQIREIFGQICSKRLQPFLPEAIKVLERYKEIELSNDTKERLFKISSASIDHCLRRVRINKFLYIAEYSVTGMRLKSYKRSCSTPLL
jgi:hypothetical protein